MIETSSWSCDLFLEALKILAMASWHQLRWQYLQPLSPVGLGGRRSKVWRCSHAGQPGLGSQGPSRKFSLSQPLSINATLKLVELPEIPWNPMKSHEIPRFLFQLKSAFPGHLSPSPQCSTGVFGLVWSSCRWGVGFHSHGGSPIAGWLISWKIRN